ncbi:MAG: hypothetical protein KJZ73_10405 [Pseudorhodoplanes sp.]|nr:hypothetical protein [Pseudorhodoplanes sp.]MCL4711643.1 hypothetical protein [Pseudorhodoplanes sp.]
MSTYQISAMDRRKPSKSRDVCAACLTGAIVTLPIVAGYAVAASYPVSGKWTYESSAEKGPARDCGRHYMEFSGERRTDTGGGVPAYRNLSVTRAGDAYRLVDEFNTGQIRARLTYGLRVVDEHHIELDLPQGKKILLRRCG